MGSEEKQEMDGGKARSIEPKESAQSPINSRQEIKDNYVVIDTNILFRIITQGVPGCEHKYWDKIQDFTKNKKITLIVPEVVLLEFEKLCNSRDEDSEIHSRKLQSLVETGIDALKNPWNELKGLTDKLKKDYHDLVNQLVSNWSARAASAEKELKKFIESDQVKRPAFDADVLLRTQKRILSGRVVPNEKGGQSKTNGDNYIVDSLVLYFVKTPSRGRSQLLLCTENVNDFGIKAENDVITIHPNIKDGLPPAQVFNNLESLVEFIDSDKTVVVPNIEQIEEALERKRSQDLEVEATPGTDGLVVAKPLSGDATLVGGNPFAPLIRSTNELQSSAERLGRALQDHYERSEAIFRSVINNISSHHLNIGPIPKLPDETLDERSNTKSPQDATGVESNDKSTEAQ